MSPRAGKAYQKLVQEIAQAVDPEAEVSEGEWVEGPDGRLDMDVSIRGTLDGQPILGVIECKDFDPSATGKVGRPLVDAFESKRRDLGADFAIMCSNAGFTSDALNKGRRTGIGMISVLKRGDDLVKAEIREVVILKRIRFDDVQVRYHGLDDTISRLDPGPLELHYEDECVDAWLQTRAAVFAAQNPRVTEPLLDRIRLKEPTAFRCDEGEVTLTALDIRYRYDTTWLEQEVRLDASLGIYDYLRGHVRLAPGERSYVIEGINFEEADPLPEPPTREKVRRDLQPGEVRWEMMMVSGLKFDEAKTFPKLEALVVEDDLSLELQEELPEVPRGD